MVLTNLPRKRREKTGELVADRNTTRGKKDQPAEKKKAEDTDEFVTEKNTAKETKDTRD